MSTVFNGNDWKRGFSDNFVNTVVVSEVVLLILFGMFTDYSDGATNIEQSDQSEMDHFYPLFQDVHVMIFIGFGFLMTFLSKFGFSAVALNFFLAAFTIQWSILCRGFWENAFHDHEWKIIELDVETLITADFSAAVVLITFGAVLGKTTPFQMIIVAIIETFLAVLNEVIGIEYLEAVDMGGSMFVHMFGGFFGIALAGMINTSSRRKITKQSGPEESSYNSDLFAMIGTLFLWMFWPSFNGALARDSQQRRVVVNTLLALTASCVVTFATSRYVNGGKFDMVHIQNATLAGGVAVGSSADLVLRPWGALLVGCIAGCLSTLGYVYLTPFLSSRFGIHDTCGVNNLHGLPGLLGGIVGAITASTAGSEEYGQPIGLVFPARASGRTASEQAWFQVGAIGFTVMISILGGIFTGWLLNTFTSGPDRFYHDKSWWSVPEDSKFEDEGISEVPVHEKVEKHREEHEMVSPA